MFDFLRDDEKEVFLKILDQVKKFKTTSKEAKEIRKPVSIEKWVEDPYYVGSAGMALYPFWKEKMVDVFREENEITEIIVDGSIGCRPLKDRVQTSVGWKRLEDMCRSSYSNVYKIFCQAEFDVQRVSSCRSVGKKKTRIIYLSDGSSIEVTKDHRLVKSEDGNQVWVRADELKVGDIIPKQRRSCYFPTKGLDDGYAFILGCYYSDKNSYVDIDGDEVSFSVRIDKQTIERLNRFVRGQFFTFKKIEGENVLKVTILNNKIAKYFKRGFDDAIAECSEDDYWQVVEAVIRQTGDISEKRIHIEIDGELARSIQIILNNLGCKVLLCKEGLSVFDEQSIFQIISNTSFREKASLVKQLSFEPTTYYEVGVVDIQDSEAVCGDIEVENEHTYLYQGIINHNTGKSTFAGFCLIRKLYELSCYENIAGLFDLMPASMIAFMYFSVSKTQAELTGYGQVKNIIDQIPYFQDKFPRYEGINSMILFPEQVMMLFGSSPGHVIGMNLIGCILDEANFRQQNTQASVKETVDNSKVAAMYNSVINRGASRFMSKGKNHSLAILVSSNTTSSSFTEQRKAKTRGNPHVKVINARLWDVKPKGTYSNKGFWVFVGSDTLDPMICEAVEDVYQYTDSVQLPRYPGVSIEDVLEKLEDIHREMFTWVPEDFRDQYESNIILALQDISGYSVAPTGRLFSNHQKYNEAVDSIYEHPLKKNVIILSTKDQIKIHDYLRPEWSPRNRDKLRYLHIDQSLRHDRTGFASTYIHHFIKTDAGVFLPSYVTDMMISIAPPKAPASISIRKVTEFIYYMRDVLKLSIGWVSYDSYSSAGAIQELESEGIPCGLLSVDKNDEQYMYMVNCIVNDQLKTYNHPIFKKELFDLIWYRELRKVDHPQAYYGVGENSNQTWGGSKDLTDAVCGSIWNAYVHGEAVQSTSSPDEVYSVTASDYNYDEFNMVDMIGYNVEKLEDMEGIVAW